MYPFLFTFELFSFSDVLVVSAGFSVVLLLLSVVLFAVCVDSLFWFTIDFAIQPWFELYSTFNQFFKSYITFTSFPFSILETVFEENVGNNFKFVSLFNLTFFPV